MSPNPKMFRVPASRVIAFVANLLLGWYFPKVKHPRKPMNLPKLGLVTDLSVTIRIFASRPAKAIIHNFGLFLESSKGVEQWKSNPSFSVFFVNKTHTNTFPYSYTEVN